MSTPLILASASPRRTALLSQMGITHTVCAVNIDESPLAGERPQAQVERLAMQKAQTCYNLLSKEERKNTMVLASDTLIALDGVSLGKPVDLADCQRMLRALSARHHQVLTAISVHSAYYQQTQCITVDVEFAPLSDEDILAYWQTGEPADKAGAYAIQGIGGQFVKAINGSVSAVIGLPLYETKQLLKCAGVKV